MIEGAMPPRGARVAVAMSGGVDSSAAALLLRQAGYDVAGVTLKLFCLGDDPSLESERSCCSAEAIDDAAATAARIGIPHHVWDFSEPFREAVIDPFRAEYFAGRTPNPCVACNRRVRFRLLLGKVRRSGFPFLATGHYARIVDAEGGGRALLRGRDTGKDQSYVLWGIEAKDLDHLVFPVGGMEKGSVRETLARAGLPVATKRESQDICFLPDGDLRRFLGGAREGDVIDREGHVVGRHDGAAHFTLGQRRGLGVAAGEALYVTEVDVARNRVRLGPDSDLFGTTLEGEDANLLVPREALESGRLRAKIRYRHEPQPARVRPLGGGRLHVRFDEPQRAITPGQSVAIYRGERLLGGAIIRRAARPNEELPSR